MFFLSLEYPQGGCYSLSFSSSFSFSFFVYVVAGCKKKKTAFFVLLGRVRGTLYTYNRGMVLRCSSLHRVCLWFDSQKGVANICDTLPPVAHPINPNSPTDITQFGASIQCKKVRLTSGSCIGCSSPYMRLAKHLAFRFAAWCVQSMSAC